MSIWSLDITHRKLSLRRLCHAVKMKVCWHHFGGIVGVDSLVSLFARGKQHQQREYQLNFTYIKNVQMITNLIEFSWKFFDNSVIGERTALGTTSIGVFDKLRVKLSALERKSAILDSPNSLKFLSKYRDFYGF